MMRVLRGCMRVIVAAATAPQKVQPPAAAGLVLRVSRQPASADERGGGGGGASRAAGGCVAQVEAGVLILILVLVLMREAVVVHLGLEVQPQLASHAGGHHVRLDGRGLVGRLPLHHVDAHRVCVRRRLFAREGRGQNDALRVPARL